MYRFQKFARKHKASLTTAAAIAACLVLGTTVSAWQAARAITAEVQANANEAQAKQAAAAESQQRQRAEANEQKANAERDEVKKLNDQLRRTLYAANMNLAKNAWDKGNIGRVEELLAQQRPKPGEIDLRGFEWHYLYRLCHAELLTLRGNGDAVRSLAYSPNGMRLAFPSWDNTRKEAAVTVCDAQTGVEVLGLKGHKDTVVCVMFSPDGKRLASASSDKTARIWDAHTGKELRTFEGHRNRVVWVAFSPDGKRLATCSGNWTSDYEKYVAGQVKVWEIESGNELFSKELADGVLSVTFSPDGKRLLTVSGIFGRGELTIWDAQTGEKLDSIKDDGLRSVAFSPDGKRLATAGTQIKLWDSDTHKQLLAFKDGARNIAFSPDGNRLACAERFEVKIRDAMSGDEVFALHGHRSAVIGVAFSPEGGRLASSSVDGTIKVWDATASPEPQTIGGQSIQFRGVCFSPDGDRVAFGTVQAWDESKKNYADAAVIVSDSRTGQEMLKLSGHTGAVNSVAFSADGRLVASASSDKSVKVWDAKTGKELLTLNGHTTDVMSVVFNPNGTRIASTGSLTNQTSSSAIPGERSEVKVWDVRSGEELFELKGHGRYVNAVTFSPDGKQLATLSRDKTVKVWNAQTGQNILTLNAPPFMWGSVVFSPDGKRLAASCIQSEGSGSRSGEIKVWDAETGGELFSLKASPTQVSGLVFSPDGKRLVAGTGGMSPRSSGELKVWDALTGHELITLDGSSGPSNDVAFSPDGNRLAARGLDGTLKIFDATPVPEKP
jgi:WD40 repeat protein